MTGYFASFVKVSVFVLNTFLFSFFQQHHSKNKICLKTNEGYFCFAIFIELVFHLFAELTFTLQETTLKEN